MLSQRLKNFADVFARFPKQMIVIVSDLMLTIIAFWYTLYIAQDLAQDYDDCVAQLGFILCVQAFSYWTFGLYRGVWRFASLPDLMRIIKACVAGTFIIYVSDVFFALCQQSDHFSFTLFGLLTAGLLSGSRLSYRWYKDNRKIFMTGERVLVVGAGTAGESILRELKRKTYKAYLPVGLVDDDPSKLGVEIQGIRVLGSIANIDKIAKKKGVQLILIAIPKADAAEMRRVVDLCEKTKIPYRTLPSLYDIAKGKANIAHIRQVSVEDLLSREPVEFDAQSLRDLIQHKNIMITGSGGSIGSELCRKIAALMPKLLILVEHSEFNLFQIETELKKTFPELKIANYLMSITDAEAITQIMRDLKPDYVFHAAAYKHVPLLEPQVRRAVHNNVLGTEMLARAALENGVKQFILVSTDKAVNPANVMGATKRSAEMLCQMLNHEGKTRFTTVRFGNVLGSTGSVVPLFKQQIAEGGPVTVTHPDMERYFMTIREAAQLIIQTLTILHPKDLYVLDMGEPVKIQYLAEQMIKLSGHKPYEDIHITYSGLRPGEKINEELFYEHESIASKEQEKILCVNLPTLDVNVFATKFAALKDAYHARLDEATLKALLFALVE